MRRARLLAAVAAAVALTAAPPAQAQDDVVDCTASWLTSPTEQTYSCIRPTRSSSDDLDDTLCHAQVLIRRVLPPDGDPVVCFAFPPEES